ncbi:hypothetical protein BTJ35_07730 [Lactobacillus delbrueckii subsp. bulgaricus]|uniref:serine O-acetyltransferase n=1 Tax=Lactobacillus delbrueckii TaxID=1584 RepID=UPI0009589C4B|nr:hypothetical protein [Lactobacillus delbrueckii]APV47950.1 hypothetical protein LB080_08860 [Lactobacillus delbrueckii subsp. bulgaricus]MBT9089324.1 hypothetical protein [Lactobacillus delbrueckii subsp. bulgaricus]MBT9090926.1 hypothetical protein [Lactobacillus delbrueckii subsp. bulgaricus]MBT9092743.1 hypothetical protein [Lactobacillus delbrueckii subsp. bulgaricus]MBT9094398.1 hypothetical protein [Lactobacillus delbrueckii subsp. bulgaricus]
MIESKEELIEYLKCDQYALYRDQKKRPSFGTDEIWRFEIALRHTEYYFQSGNKLLYLFWKARYHRLSVKLGFSIPLNVFGKGLSIAHYGSIVVNSNARIGEFCRIQENVTIGATGGSSKAPVLGNRVFIGSGARLLGDITIGDDCAIGANAVVTKNFSEKGKTIAGVPARIISNKGSSSFIRRD